MSRIRRIAPGLGRGGLLGNTEGPESYLRELDTLPSQFCRATGGTETVISQGGKFYRVHTFTDVGTSSLTFTRGGVVEYLVVGGGGGGGTTDTSTAARAGGGAGGLLQGSLTLASKEIQVSVGGGGAGGAFDTADGANGGDSTLDSLLAFGGGGSDGSPFEPGKNGGSGGGGSGTSGASVSGGTGVSGQGNNGGNTSATGCAAGGGGAGAAGGNASTNDIGGAGGDGVASSITGSSTYYAGGGGGGGSTTSGSGGLGGGGDAVTGGNGQDGTANTGGGGGGIGDVSGLTFGGDGGSGIVIVRYRITPAEYFQGLDPDAAAYIQAVEAADGQKLENSVVLAIDSFVQTLKADGNWDAIKASCILCGARTLAGALVPLKGTAPTKQGTEGGWDYNRTNGLSGNGTNNTINTNRKNNDDPTDNNHNYFWATTKGNNERYMGSWPGSGANLISDSSGSYGFRNRTDQPSVGAYTPNANSGVGMSRSGSTNINVIRNGVVTSFAQSSQTANSNDVYLLGVDGFYTTARVKFYSIGEAVDLALLDTAVSTLVSEIGAAV